ncbi:MULTISPECIES: SufE family protein [Acidiphilium]|jgi:cysteine desulfuration protein SufE|uniref:Putative cysteine desulfuration protein SufE n=1 Tax=Acidiphilium multivorum (strain DSM 11245 / JCM 8867 / NBRC 100883 / AIU 301) TaxID=926570 RepID=F0IX84_ACIMA|nr:MULTISPECIES: SufE family protein [Acidiphilium]MDE2326896.1 SufE family protein [Rhodospirillales bacterium]EGO95776.1 Fe-S metabolism associated SufE [Acidiphilium sp. PM]KDM67496.1 Fe-S metabolism associated SufE [Acidiphilium sp. JA12-A1]MBS3024200.1 SufE family protein [Acidiphilium multivorum]UNC15646.1 SufE family protein [Acidiphilium multivorum]
MSAPPFVTPAQESAAAAIAALHDELFLFDDWMDRYQFIIELGQSLPAFPEALKTDDRLVPGCQSRVWLEPKLEGGKLYFAGASDAAIVSGLVAMLLQVYSGRTPAEIRETPPVFLKEWGLIGALSGNRGNGVAAMAERIQRFAAS